METSFYLWAALHSSLISLQGVPCHIGTTFPQVAHSWSEQSTGDTVQAVQILCPRNLNLGVLDSFLLL